MSMTSPLPGDTGSRRDPGVPDPGQASAAEVAALIEEILGIGEMAADENFFEVGGSSILALTLISRIEQRWAVTLSLINVIHNATPELLAELITNTPPGAPAP
jgi:acyl carrier protein